ncbi:hypothetical protein SNE40_012189 [Patella caerulea]|uniref:Iodothyronine deiodinase n=1 Tax=Patella caerulea TaxID=87958 RepID=A0AAN8JRU8_PATCE
MAKLRKFNELVRNFADDIDFLTVYIEEAHPNDGWRIANDTKYDYKQHVILEDRIQAAGRLLEAGVESPVVLDTMENEANAAFAALPERLFIILNGVVVYEGGRGPILYNLGEVENWILKFKGC